MMRKADRSPLMRLRVQRFLTQKDLADQLGVSVTTIRNWEAGRVVPRLTPPQYKKLLEVLEIAPSELPDQFGFPEGEEG